jgi:hypothetical protein
MNNLDSFDENKVKCRDCAKYIERDSAGAYVDLDKNFRAIKDYYLCGICIHERHFASWLPKSYFSTTPRA